MISDEISCCVCKHTDDEALNQDLPDLINDDVEEEGSNDEGGSDHSDKEGGKRRHRDSDIDEDLEEEDYDLIEENLGIKVNRVSCVLTAECILDTQTADLFQSTSFGSRGIK